MKNKEIVQCIPEEYNCMQSHTDTQTHKSKSKWKDLCSASLLPTYHLLPPGEVVKGLV